MGKHGSSPEIDELGRSGTHGGENRGSGKRPPNYTWSEQRSGGDPASPPPSNVRKTSDVVRLDTTVDTRGTNVRPPDLNGLENSSRIYVTLYQPTPSPGPLPKELSLPNEHPLLPC